MGYTVRLPISPTSKANDNAAYSGVYITSQQTRERKCNRHIDRPRDSRITGGMVLRPLRCRPAEMPNFLLNALETRDNFERGVCADARSTGGGSADFTMINSTAVSNDLKGSG